MALKVLMMGGRRCGKTSVLASMFDQMKNGRVNSYLTISDQTVLKTKFNEETQQMETQDSLDGKILELQQMLGTSADDTDDKIFLVDSGPTSNFWYYNLNLKIPGTRKEMSIEFRDSAGEFFEAGGEHSDEVKEYIEECDVFVIVVDTPYLMRGLTENDGQLCTEAINSGTNRVGDIKNFLCQINDHEGKDAKMVLFVPVKCEKWASENRMEDVVKRVECVYAKIIEDLKAYSKMTIGIFPIQTAGNIWFEEFRDAYIITGKIGGTKRCCLLSDTTVRLENGTPKKIGDNDTLNDDPKAKIAGTNLVRPYSWYKINPKNKSYSPINCEQLPLHIIRFMLEKEKNIIKADDEKSGFFAKLWRKIKAVFGNMPVKDLENVIEKLEKEGVYKHTGQDIKYIKECY